MLSWFKSHAAQLGCAAVAAGLYAAVAFGKLDPKEADAITGGLLLLGLHLPAVTYKAVAK